MRLANLIGDGLSRLRIPANDDQLNNLVEYIRLLEKWNKAYNLTAVRGAEEMVIRHILDSLSIVYFVDGERIADLGSGAGLPGIPLSIMLRDASFTLIDSKRKKSVFLNNVCRQLNLANVEVAWSRFEEFHAQKPFDILVARAVSSAREIIRTAGHLCKAGGEILLMKSRDAESELDAIPSGYELINIEPLSVPGLDADRKLLRIGKLEN